MAATERGVLVVTVDLATHLVADATDMWVRCDCGADTDHDSPDIAPAETRKAVA